MLYSQVVGVWVGIRVGMVDVVQRGGCRVGVINVLQWSGWCVGVVNVLQLAGWHVGEHLCGCGRCCTVGWLACG